MNRIFLLGIVGCIIIFIHYVYFKSKIGHNTSFVTLTNIYIGLCTFATIYSILLSNKINYANVINNQLSNMTPLFQNITENISTFFTSNPNMNYYYNELFNGVKNEDKSFLEKSLIF